MGEKSNIEWTDHTWSPWRGCTKVSDGCKNCYAEALSKRNPAVLGEWGPKGNRVYSKSWDLPMKWNRQAAKAGEIRKVFPSLCDPFDEAVPDAWRDNFFTLAFETEWLIWLVLTKRPQEALRYMQRTDIETPFPENAWIGTSVENQDTADERIPLLLQIPATKRFLSCEPLLGPIEFSDVTRRSDAVSMLGKRALSGIDWVIVGGESGPKARPMHPAWARSLRDQSVAAGVAFHFKQWGEYRPEPASNAVWADGSPVAKDLEPMRVERIGKKAAGRILDGREWNEVPA